MLKYVEGSLFFSPALAQVNTVNTVGVMGKGIALEFKRQYPAMFEEYKRLCRTGSLQIGTLYYYRAVSRVVINFPTKTHWRFPSKPEYIEAGLQEFVRTYRDMGITSVAFPALGSGNGGLDFPTQVQPLMEQYLRGLPKISIEVYLPSPA